MTHETWRDVVGYEGHYQVSNLGRVRSLDHEARNGRGTCVYKGRVLNPKVNSLGYGRVTLWNGKKIKNYFVHRLVAMMFIPNDRDLPEVLHINGDVSDNRVENLKWASIKDRTTIRDKRLFGDRPKKQPKTYKTDSLPNEEWRPVIGYEGYYEVSNLGRVKRLSRTVKSKTGRVRTFPSRIITPSNRGNGYATVSLSKNGVSKTPSVHRLVAFAFLEPDPTRNVVDHINGIKNDNRAENLRWATDAENHRHAVELGLIDVDAQRQHVNSPEFRAASLAANRRPVIRSDGKRFNSLVEAAESIGSTEGSVSNVARGKQKTTKGYSFKFADKS